MRGEWELAMKLPVLSTLRAPDPSKASDIIVAVVASPSAGGGGRRIGSIGPNNYCNDMRQQRGYDADGIAPLQTPPPIPMTSSGCCGGAPTTITTVGEMQRSGTVEVHPITIRKTPKFPSRDRHLAIRRKKATTTSPSVAVVPVEQQQPLDLDGAGCQCVEGEDNNNYVLERSIGGAQPTKDLILAGSGE